MYLTVTENVQSPAQTDIARLLARLNDFLTGEGIQAYLVGGFIRDSLLERNTADIDLAVTADALAVANSVATLLGGKYVLLDEVNRVGRVVILKDGKPTWQLDFSSLKGSIEHDLSDRDFTVNAMADELGQFVSHGLTGSVIIDPLGGRDDLGRKIMRAVRPEAFRTDPARLLRAIRLAAELGFNLDSETEAQVRQDAKLITSVAGERIREELVRVLAAPGGASLGDMDKLGLLTALIPELAAARGVSQPRVHYWDVFEHSLNSVSAVDFLLRVGEWPYPGAGEALAAVPWSEQLREHFAQEVSSGTTRRSLLKLAALLHDIAKPQKKTMEDGRARFLGHPQEGAEVAGGILQRLRFSAREKGLVEVIVREHMRIGQMSHEELPTRRAIYRYFRDTGDAGIDIIVLSLADHLATRGPDLELGEWRRHARVVEFVLAAYFAGQNVVVPPKLIDGHELITSFGLQPGPKIGELLEAVREAQAAGEVTTREEALAYVERLMSKPAPNDGLGEKYA